MVGNTGLAQGPGSRINVRGAGGRIRKRGKGGHRRRRRRGMAEGGALGLYHSGGAIAGMGDQLIVAEAGERVLSQAQNRTFEALVDGIQSWTPSTSTG